MMDIYIYILLMKNGKEWFFLFVYIYNSSKMLIDVQGQTSLSDGHSGTYL